MKKIVILIAFIYSFTNYYGQITTSVNPTIAQMQTLLQGNGVVVSGLSVTCPAGAYASFSNAATVFGSGLNSGILLTTGDASNVSPSFFDNSVDNSAPGSLLGDNLDASGAGTFDACYIKFLITPSCSTLSVNYVFASEEYNTYVGSINDVFGFVLDGPNPLGPAYNQTNIALIPGTALPVSINNVNNGNFPPAGPCMNCAYFIDAPPGIVYNGSTTVLTASTIVTPCQTYTMTIGIWDVSDGILDSGVFLDVNGLSCANVPAITASVNPTTICGAQSVTLTASGAAPSGTYSWSAPATGGLSTTTGSVVTANPTGTTIYSVSYTDMNTCPGLPVIVPVTLTVTPPPALPVSQSPASSICTGQSATLTASGGAGTYSWAPAASLSTSTGSIVVSTPSVTTTYSITKTTTLGCTSTTVVTVNVTQPSTIAITPSLSTICSGQTVTLSSSGIAPFTWAASSGANPASSASVAVSPTATTTYTVLSGSGSCTATAVATVSLTANFTINVTPSSTTICKGQSASLSVSGSAGPFAWTSSTGSNPTPSGTVIVTPTITTTYTVIAGIGTCTAQAVVTVTVLPNINTTLTASSPTACLTKTVSISAPSATGLTYTWQPIGAISGANNTSSIVALPPTTATVIYTVTISNGVCIGTNTIQLLVRTPPDGNFITLNNDTICTGGCVTFSSTTTGSQPITYKWYYQVGVGTSSVGVAPEACYPSAGSFSVTMVATNACGMDTTIKNNYIKVYDYPTLIVGNDTTIKIGEQAQVYASGGLSYFWSPNIDGSTMCPTCASTIVQPTLTTQYIVVAFNSIYCKVQDTVTVIVDVNCGDFFIPNVFSPNGDGLNDAINVHGRCISKFNLQIFNRWGEKVFETSTLSESWDGTFRGQKLDTGVFVYKADGVSIDGQSFKLKGNITLIR